MKYLFLITSFFAFSILLNSDNNPLTDYISQVSLAEQLYNRLEVKTNLPIFTKRFIDRKAASRTDVPSSKWLEIKNNISYSYFKGDAIDAINNYYSNSEIQTLLNQYSDKPYIPITNVELRDELYNIASDFNTSSLIPSINSMLIQGGYNPL